MPSIHQSLIISASSEEVYSALTSQEGLSGWWTPYAVAKAEIKSIARFPFGEGYFKEMEIKDLKPYEKVEWYCISGAVEWVGTKISFQLRSDDKDTLLVAHPEAKDQIQQQLKGGKATLLIFQHDDWKEYSSMFAECSYTWGQFLRSLKLFCETGKGNPWPNQHR